MAEMVVMAATALGASAETAATIGTITSTIGTISTIGATVGGALSSMNAQKASAASTAAADEYNAKIAEQNASLANAQTAQAVKDKQRTQYLAKSENINNSGSVTGNVLDILSDNAANSEMDILNTKYNGLLASNSYLNSANLSRSDAANAITAGNTGAASAILGGVTNLAGLAQKGTLNPTKYGVNAKTGKVATAGNLF